MQIKTKFIYNSYYLSRKWCFLLGLTFANEVGSDLAAEICTGPRNNPAELRLFPGTSYSPATKLLSSWWTFHPSPPSTSWWGQDFPQEPGQSHSCPADVTKAIPSLLSPSTAELCCTLGTAGKCRVALQGGQFSLGKAVAFSLGKAWKWTRERRVEGGWCWMGEERRKEEHSGEIATAHEMPERFEIISW